MLSHEEILQLPLKAKTLKKCARKEAKLVDKC